MLTMKVSILVFVLFQPHSHDSFPIEMVPIGYVRIKCRFRAQVHFFCLARESALLVFSTAFLWLVYGKRRSAEFVFAKMLFCRSKSSLCPLWDNYHKSWHIGRYLFPLYYHEFPPTCVFGKVCFWKKLHFSG